MKKAGDEQHYIPAALIGGFGATSRTGRGRDNVVAVRWKRSADAPPRDVAARYVGWERALYRFEELNQENPDALDQAWIRLEDELPITIDRLTRRSVIPADHDWVVAYLAAVGVRNPGFGDHARRERAALGEPEPYGDAVQLERIATLRGFESLLPSLHYRVIHRSPQSFPFIVPDTGWANIELEGRRVNVFPLNGDCALILYEKRPDEPPSYRSGVYAHFTVMASVVDVINATSWWSPDTTWVAGHPAQHDYLMRLDVLRSVQWPAFGPYVGRSGELLD